MEFRKILMIGYAESDLDPEHWKRIDKICHEKVLLPRESPDIPDQLPSIDCLLLKLGMAADQKTIDSAPLLKYIGMFGTGVGNIDTEYSAKKGITVCNLYYATEAVAELSFALLLENMREIGRAKAQGENARASANPAAKDFSEASYQGSELKGKAFGVVGLGRIGGRIAEIAKEGFSADVRYWSRNRKPDYESRGIRYQSIESLLKECDIVSLNLAHVAGQTTHFLDTQRISIVKNGSIVINLSPMELVDIHALTTRLASEDHALTFILDHSDELSGEEIATLARYENCIMYPPIAYTTKEASVIKKNIFIENLENFLKGKPSNKVV
jgi:lactate dehydrogenase-like 2-hydroxyacid dehydrogenase